MNKHEEKERLYKEVLSKRRDFTTPSTKEVKQLKGSNDALEELQQILTNQQKELEELQKEIDVDQLAHDLHEDYGVTDNQPNKELFEDIEKKLNNNIKGQEEGIKSLIQGFRRPYVLNTNKKNTIILHGNSGTFKHESLQLLVEELYSHNLINDKSVSTLDMSLYSSTSNQIFIQDLYKKLNDSSSILCIENFDKGFANYLRMISDLSINGYVQLDKRYVAKEGVLVENQTGLVKNTIDRLNNPSKYLVLICEGKISKVIDAFGNDFMNNIHDICEFKVLSDDDYNQLISNKLSKLIEKVKELKLNLTIDEDVNEYIFKVFNKEDGIHGIDSILNTLYVSISDLVLKNNLMSDCKIFIDNDQLLLKNEENTYPLSKNDDSNLEEINKELDEIVGLKEVKEYIYSLQSHILMQEKRRQQGLITSDVNKHMIFTGNPGTGKTTIARLISRYMKAIGALSQGQLVEVTRADLVAQYVGQTAPLTLKVIKSALGGVLFIDEAYSLYRGEQDSFGLECIDMIVKAMEDYRDDLIVILAGYDKEMEGFLESNSGLKSRFPNIIHFPDYTGEELYQIACIQAKSKGYVLSDDIHDYLVEYFNNIQSKKAREAGNGRLARNVIEDAILNQSKRIININSDDLNTLILEDFKKE